VFGLERRAHVLCPLGGGLCGHHAAHAVEAVDHHAVKAVDGEQRRTVAPQRRQVAQRIDQVLARDKGQQRGQGAQQVAEGVAGGRLQAGVEGFAALGFGETSSTK
jgi:hypothetical protein